MMKHNCNDGVSNHSDLRYIISPLAEIENRRQVMNDTGGVLHSTYLL